MSVMPSSSSPAAVHAYKGRMVLLELLAMRGFDTSVYQGSTVAEVHSMMQTKQMDMLLSKADSEEKVYVKYNTGKALRTNDIYDWVEDLYHLENVLGKSDELIIVAKDPPNDSIKKVLRDLWSRDSIFITVFGSAHLQFNITKHVLVPPHRPLSVAEKDAVAAKYSIQDESQVPDISRFSPVACAIGLRPGTWCEIRRPSRVAVRSLFYRICSP